MNPMKFKVELLLTVRAWSWFTASPKAKPYAWSNRQCRKISGRAEKERATDEYSRVLIFPDLFLNP